ncbi:hypothetical protein HYW20_00480 [Candidatus Woesearchaeota archaeon]|nr:hypothetical protein [Candidatus Woesearchaeota archaeon]
MVEPHSIDDLFAPGTSYAEVEEYQGSEILFGILTLPQSPKEHLAAYIKLKGGYNGNNPDTMLAIFDALHDKEEGLSYGLKGVEKLNRNPKALLGLKHPGKLVEYMLITSEDISELSQLLGEFQGAMNHLKNKSHNFSYYDKGYSKLRLSLEELAQQVIVIGTGVANHIGHITFKSYINSLGEGEKAKKSNDEAFNRLCLLRDAYSNLALAAQILGSKQLVLDYMRLHEETGGSYEIKGISYETLNEYAFHKHGMDTASTGNIPKSMKYDMFSSPLNRIIFGLSFDDFFRLEHFKEVDDLAKEPKEETSVKVQPASDADFALFGINNKNNWEEASKKYRSLMKARYIAVFSSSSLHQNTGEVQRFNDAFGRIREFYKQKALQEQKSA